MENWYVYLIVAIIALMIGYNKGYSDGNSGRGG